MSRSTRVLAACLPVAFPALALATSQPSFTATQINLGWIAPTNYVTPEAANSTGEVAGYAGFVGNTFNGQFIGVGAVATSAVGANPTVVLPFWSGNINQVSQSHFYGINDSGTSVGVSYVNISPYASEGYYSLANHAVVYSGGSLQDIGTLGGTNSFAYGVNNGGTVVGYSQLANGSSAGFSYSGGMMSSIGTLPGGGASYAYAVNNFGEISGFAQVGSSTSHAFTYSGGEMTDRGTAPGLLSGDATAVSDNGLIAGYGSTTTALYNGTSDAIADFGSGFVDLGYLYTSSTGARLPMAANGINSFGDVVGYSVTPNYGPRAAFLYRQGQLYNLNDFLPASLAGWQITNANSINDSGWISATALAPGSTTLQYGLLLQVNLGAPTWSRDASASWGNAANWSGGAAPNGVGASAILGSAITSARTVTLDGATTLGVLRFDSASSYTVAGPSALTLSSGSSVTQGLIEVNSGSHAITAPVAFVGNLGVSIEPGSVLSVGTIDGAGTLSVASGGVLKVGGRLSAGALSVDAISLVDLGEGEAVLTASSEAAVGSLVAGWLATGYGLGSSAGVPLATLGVITNSDGQGGGLYSSFGGVAVAPTDVLVRYTYVGDTTLKGYVDATDLANTLAGIAGGLTGWENGDFNYDGVVDPTDLGLLLNSLANQGAPFGSVGGPSGAVPEPSSLMLGGAAVVSLCGRRRRLA